LKAKHHKVIALHLDGCSNKEIAAVMGSSGAWVSQVLNSEVVQPILSRCFEDYERELQAMTGPAVNRLRRIIETGEDRDAKGAIDILFKRQGAYDRAAKAHMTAEDVIERILEQVAPDGTRTKMTERRLLRHDPIVEVQEGV
jgi:hypothetical protein